MSVAEMQPLDKATGNYSAVSLTLKYRHGRLQQGDLGPSEVPQRFPFFAVPISCCLEALPELLDRIDARDIHALLQLRQGIWFDPQVSRKRVLVCKLETLKGSNTPLLKNSLSRFRLPSDTWCALGRCAFYSKSE